MNPTTSTELVASNSSLFVEPSRWEHLNRVATTLAASALVPQAFQKNPANCLIALEISQRIGASPLMVMQNLNLIHGKPSFSASFMIGAVNACGRFTPLEFTYVGETGKEDWGCFAVATKRSDGKELKGSTVTMAIAKKEGWTTRSGSKWATFPELMLAYRAATWWTRMFAPELLLGFPTADEVIDRELEDVAEAPTQELPARRTSNKGVSGLKTMKSVEPVKDDEPKQEQAPAAEKSEAEPTKAAEPEKPAEKPAEPPTDQTEDGLFPEAKATDFTKARCEIGAVEERRAKKANGTTGIASVVTLKGKEYEGIAYYDGPAKDLPAVGAVVDVVLEAKNMGSGARAQVLKEFTIVA